MRINHKYPRKVSIIFLVVFCLLSSLLWSQEQPAAEEQVVIARGVGAVIGGDVAKAEDDAIASALRNAVEQVVGTMVESEVLVQNYQVVEDQIYSRTKGYVKSYEVIEKGQRGDAILEITIRAVVKKSNLENDLEAVGLIIARKGRPRLMVLVDERNMERHYYYYSIDLNTTETSLQEVLLAKGFPFVDQQTVMRKLKRDAVMAAIEGETQVAHAIAGETGAEVLIVGKAIAKPSSAGPAVVREAGFVSCQATVNLRAIRADDGRVIATTSQQAVAAHIDQITGGTQALKKAAEMAAEDLASKIIKVWRADIYGGTTVQLRVLDVPAFSDLVQFKNLIKANVRGVQKIYQREFTGTTALLDLEMRGSANQLAEEFALKDFSPYELEVIQVSQNTVILKLKTKP